MLTISQGLYVLPKNAMEWFVTIDCNAMRLTGDADKFVDVSMQSVQPSLGLIFFDRFSDMLGYHLEVTFICNGCQGVQFCNGLTGK